MLTITFNNRTFSHEMIDNMSISECLTLFNQIRSVRETGSERKQFRTKTEAVDLTWKELMQMHQDIYGNEDQSESAPVVVQEKPKKKRGKTRRFQFPRNDEPLKSCREGSLRDRVIKLLDAGNKTFDDVLMEVKQFDIDRGKAPHNDEQRAYEIIRILHYQMNYGMEFDDETGVITLIK